MADDEKRDQIDETKTFIPKFDKDGLMPAIAIEKSTGTLLMMAWVNDEALKKTLDSGYAHFWSRSRKAFWEKGETSGNRLKIIDILIDCDQDSLCLHVEMEGDKAACHTGRRTCYYRKLKQTPTKDEITLEFIGDTPKFDPKQVYGN